MSAETTVEKRLLTLDTLRGLVAGEVAAQPHLGDLRRFNQLMVGELGKCTPIKDRAMLDLGASIHGYALESALDSGVALYEGIDLDVTRHWGAATVEVSAPEGRTGRLRVMNAERLDFADDSFDCLLSISTFEHFHRPDVVLNEMFRVLRPGGAALISTEPIWTGSYGHHLHHFGALSDRVPPWSHLYLNKEQMHAVLERQDWPADAPISRADALHWIYDGDGINRHSVERLKTYFAQSPFEVDWIVPLTDPTPPERAALAAYVARLVPYSADDLLTRGLSLVLRKR